MKNYLLLILFSTALILNSGILSGQGTPQIISTYPAIHSNTARVDSCIRIRYNSSIDMSSVNDSTFCVYGKQFGIYHGTFTWDNSESAVVFTPDRNFFYGEQVYCVITDKIKDIDGDYGPAYVLSFRTGTIFKSGFLESSPSWVSSKTEFGYEGPHCKFADLNRDGWLDIICKVNGRTIRVYENQGNGTFPSSASYTITIENSQSDAYLEFADVDMDGDLDFIDYSHEGYELKKFVVYSNDNGILTNNEIWRWTTTGEWLQLTAMFGFFNEDTYPDLAIVKDINHFVFINNSGSFPTEPSWSNIAVSAEYSAIDWIDFNNDGYQDLLMSGYLYENKSGDNLVTKQIINVWKNCLINGDVDNDSYCEVGSSFGQSANIYDNTNGILGTDPEWEITLDTWSTVCQFADVDGDSDLDISFALQVIKGVQVFFNNNGVFNSTANWEITADGDAGNCEWGDVDNDGDLDLMTILNDFDKSTRIVIYYNAGTSVELAPLITSVTPEDKTYAIFLNSPVKVTFNQVMDESSFNQSNITVRGDKNGIYAGKFRYDTSLCEMIYTSDNYFTSGEKITVTLSTGVKNKNGVGLAEPYSFAFTTESESAYHLLEKTPSWASNKKGGTRGGVGFNEGKLVDINRDNYLDIVSKYWYNEAEVFLNDGNGNFPKDYSYSIILPNTSEFGRIDFADVDSDNDKDMMVSADGYYGQTVTIYENSNGTLTANILWEWEDAQDPEAGPLNAKFGFLNNDTLPDIAILDNKKHLVFINYSGTYKSYPDYSNIEINAHGNIEWFDFDNDGDQDIIFGRTLYENKEGSLSKKNLLPEEYHMTSAGDFDGNDYPDIAGVSYSNAKIYINNLGTFSLYPLWSNIFDVTTMDCKWIDIDGDNDLDLSFISYYPFSASIFMNNNGQILSTPGWTTYGQGDAERFDWGDVDNDGDLDLFIVNGSGTRGYAGLALFYNHRYSDRLTPLSVTLASKDVSVIGESDGVIDLTVAGGLEPYFYQWSNGERTEDLIDLPGGKYVCVVTDAAGNIAKDSVIILDPLKIKDLDGNIYRIVEIGKQIWMAENLNTYSSNGSWYYNNDSIAYSDSLGRLYNWEISKNICPSGWYLPSDDEWKILESYLGMNSSELNNTGWRGTDQGTQLKEYQEPGFGADLGGFRNSSGDYSNAGFEGYYWTSTSPDDLNAWYRDIDTLHTNIYRNQGTIESGYSIRCIKDTCTYKEIDLIPTNISCPGKSDGSVKLSVRGGNLPFKYLWSTGDTTQNINNLTADLYKITVTDKIGCITTDSAVIVEPAQLFVSIIDSSDISCRIYRDGTATCLAEGGTPPYLYNWSDSKKTTTPKVTGLSADQYYFINVTDFYGCSSVDSVKLSGPPQIITGLDEYLEMCEGDQVTVTVNEGYESYSWSVPDSTTNHLTVVSAGLYSVTVTDTNDCYTIDSINVSYKSAPNISEICIVTTNLEGKNSVVWEKSDNQDIIAYNIYREGEYLDQYKLIGTVGYDNYSVFVDTGSYPEQQPYRYKITSVNSCGAESYLGHYHQTIHLQISQGINSWNLNWSDYQYEVGSKSFLKYDIFRGNSKTNMVLIKSLSSSFSSFSDINPPAGFLYYRVAGLLSNICYPTGNLKSDQSIDYSYSNFRDNGLPGGFSDYAKSQDLKIYPNPASDLFIISFTNPDNAKYLLYLKDLNGRIIRRIEPITNSNIEINCDDIQPGCYFIEVRGTNIYRGRIIIE